MSKFKVDSNFHLLACIDQEKYNELSAIIYQHHSQVIPDFTLTKKSIKDVLIKTFDCYENSLKNAEKEIKRLNEVVAEKEQMIDSLLQTNVHIRTLNKE